MRRALWETKKPTAAGGNTEPLSFFFFKKLCIYFKHMPCVRLSLVPEAVTAWGTIWKQRPERDDAGSPRPLGLVDKTSSAWSRQKRWAEAP